MNRGTGRGARRRCSWAQRDPGLMAYHDVEWGVPELSGRKLWEKLMLDGFQAGLSWSIVLRKRAALRRAFRGFDPEKVAAFGPREVRRLLKDPRIIRSEAKIRACIDGARAYRAMQERGEEFSAFVWGFVDRRPLQRSGSPVARTPLSERISQELKARGFRFVGPVIVYAWMQAIGLVNDHAPYCFRRKEVRALGSQGPLSRPRPGRGH